MSQNRFIDDSKTRDIILDSIADGVFTVDMNWNITSFNRAAERITGVLRDEAIGQRCKDVLKADVCGKNCILKKTMQTGKSIINKTVYIVNATGLRLPVSISTSLLRDKKGRVVGAVETFRDLSIEDKLRKKITQRYSFEDIISKNHKMHQLFDILPDVAISNSTVLLEGESGTGKELFAKAIHNLSGRKNKPFVAVNCAALPDTLLESELFGYRAGAFTDAKKDKVGRFQLAVKGTLFLDEIGDISSSMQIRLLRVLQEKTFEPLGATESVKNEARIIAATNQNLLALVKKGIFREDLYYRINVVKLELPPLRERLEDVPLLVARFIEQFNAATQRNIRGVSGDAMSVLASYSYPGNIRELENIIERAFILCKSNIIGLNHLPDFLNSLSKDNSRGSTPSSLKDAEAKFLLQALNSNNWNRLETARQLGIHKTTLYRKMRTLGIKSPLSSTTATC